MKHYAGTTISVDRTITGDYEINSPHKKLFNFLFTPILNNIPSSWIHSINRSSRAAHHVVENKTSHEALETLYSCGHSHPPENIVHKFFGHIWFNVSNSKAVRNRLKLVRRELINSMREVYKKKGKVDLLSIASGSARSVIEALADIILPPDQVRVSFLDKNPNALEYSKRLALEKGVRYDLRWFNDTASGFPVYYEIHERPNIIEMVGLLDYFSPEKTLDILKTIYENLEPGGVLITANISDNVERKFISNIVGWHMVYKSAMELIDIAANAGFERSKMRALYEPLHIHCVLIAMK